MSKKTLIYFVLSAILVALVYFAISTQEDGTIKNDFIIADTSSVTTIFMADLKGNSVKLEKKDGVWYANDNFEAVPGYVDVILKTFARINIKYPLGNEATETALKRLSSNHTKVEIYQDKAKFHFLGMGFFKKNRLTKTFYIGGPTSDNTGTIMKMENDDQIYVTHIPGMNGYLSERFSTRLADWKSHEIFNYNISKIKEVKVEFPTRPHESYKIINNSNKTFDLIQLMGDKRIDSYDTIRMLESLSSFNEINYELLLDDIDEARKDSIRNSTPTRIISLVLSDGKKRKLTLYRRENFSNQLDLDGNPFKFDVERMYGFVDNDNNAYSVQYFTADKINRPIEFLINSIERDIN